MDYALLSLADTKAQLETIVREVRATFGALNQRQLNWRPDETRWSVGQCFQHLLTANRHMFQCADDALNETLPRSVWQRLPGLPALCGKLLIRSQAPNTSGRKYKAPTKAQPGTSDIPADVIQLFVAQQRDVLASMLAVGEQRAEHVIMHSPFIRVVTYSVMDGWRIIVAHDWRHIGQARRVTQSPEFPGSV